jgi:hypothetical protein
VADDAPTILRLSPKGLTLQDGRVARARGLGTLILALQDLQRQAEERGQRTIMFWNASPAGVDAALCEGTDGKLFLHIDGFGG